MSNAPGAFSDGSRLCCATNLPTACEAREPSWLGRVHSGSTWVIKF